MNDEFYMNQALLIAEMAEGQTANNPLVGALIVANGCTVGIGAHLKAGEAHAEVHALTMAGDKAKGGTMYVTLEPCCHVGKTPPCVDAIIRAGLKRVVIATKDPNPLVAGKGIDCLKRAGIDVTVGVLEERAQMVNSAFFHSIQLKRPFITVKQAITLDGKLSSQPGRGEAITGDAVRKDVHRDRELSDAILVGIDTVLADNPSLTNRYGNTNRQPIRVVLDSSLRMPADARLVQDGLASTWIFTTERASREASFSKSHVKVIRLPTMDLDIKDVLRELYRRDVTNLYVEAGSSVCASFLETGLVDKLITYIAPKIVGGTDGVPMTRSLGIQQMSEAFSFNLVNVEQIGSDIKLTSLPVKG